MEHAPAVPSLRVTHALFSRAVVLVALAVLSNASIAAAASPYELRSKREWTLVGSGVAIGSVALMLHARVDPLTVDEVNALDVDDINSFDRNGIHPYEDTPSSDIMAVVSYAAPLALLANADMRADWQTLGVMWGEVTALNLAVNSLVKVTVLRSRPYAYDPAAPIEKRTSTGARMSFYSGHTTGAAANCFFVARVCSDYLDNRRLEALIWTGAIVYPAVVGYLRIDSGFHFRTDVIAGYAMGAAIGYFVPGLHRSGDDRVSLQTMRILDAPALGVRVSF
ncbi:MAG TPA: phosphatase PAP2 family protein [Candidatus Krumholzibacteria bacterium]|nr:phosphatase PAP2 family protein [Candidatus Krumholzibacteria bacterium]